MYIFLQGFALNYSRTEVLHTRKIIRNAVIDVIERGLHHETDWNVKVVLETADKLALAEGLQPNSIAK